MTQRAKNIVEPLNARVADAARAAQIMHGLDGMLADLEQLIRTLPVSAYCATRAGESSIGAHVRHVVEFIQMLVDHVDSGVVDYENRKRNIVYETDPRAVAALLPPLRATLAHMLKHYGTSHPLELRETTLAGGDKLSITTSLGREMLFMLQHGVHHLAIIKMQAAAMNIALGSQFGVAVATQAYREQVNG